MQGRLLKVLALAGALAATGAVAQIEPNAPPSLAPPPAVVDWVRAHAVGVGPVAEPPQDAEARAIARLATGARVIGLGEAGHGKVEPPAWRNRLIRHLVEHEGLTAVALESGLAEGRRIHDYVLGRPGDATTIVRQNLTHGFGMMQANVELVEWLRAWNDNPAHRPVHFYGIDLSTIQTFGQGERGYGVILGDVIAYLARSLPQGSVAVRADLLPFGARFTEVDYPFYSEAERARLRTALAAAAALFGSHKAAMIAATSREDYDWAAREAYDAHQLPAVFAAWTLDPLHELPNLKELIALRDRAMAGHLLWALKREGPRGRILLFQANGHVAAAPLVGSLMRLFPSQPPVTGMILRARLGQAYRAVATASGMGRGADDPAIGSVDRAFIAAKQTRALLDIRTAPRDGWWSATQSFTQGGERVDDAVPTAAFDAVLYFDRLTALPTLPPPT